MKLITLMLLVLLFSCSQNHEFVIDFPSLSSKQDFLTQDQLDSKFETVQNMQINEICQALAKNKINTEKPINFATVSHECNGKSIEQKVSVKNQFNGTHHHYEADKAFPFYQQQTAEEGIIKDLCNMRTGEKLITMSKHGASIKYIFNLHNCKKNHFCLEAGTVVKDYQSKKFRLIRKEYFEIDNKGTTTMRELAYKCKDNDSIYRYQASFVEN